MDSSRQELQDRLDQVEADFAAFQQESAELEQFLESEIDSTNNKLSEMGELLKQREDEAAELREKLAQLSRQLQDIRTSRASEGRQKESRIDELSKQVVALEVKNQAVQDELRAKKAGLSSEYERSNAYLERIAVLESELHQRDVQLEQEKEENRQLKRQVKLQADENSHLAVRLHQMEKILKLATFNRDDIKVSKFQTPPVTGTTY